MFDLFEDIAKGVGSVVGVITGSVIGIATPVIATALGITIAMVEEALRAGCNTYEDIRDFHNL